MSIQLEAFEAPIKGRRIRWFLSQDQPISYPPGFQEQILTEHPPFQRKILLSSHSSSEAWKLVDTYDAIFLPQTPMEWSLILAFIQNNLSPCLIIITPELQVPVAFYQKSAQLPKPPCIIAFNILSSATVTPLTVFDATFFPPSKDLESYIDQVQSLLQSYLSSDFLRSFIIKDVIRDLKSAGATIVISSIEESKASLYWYYTSDSAPKSKRLIEEIVQTLLKRNV